jgi:alcohol dehydrogenase YqhD (iron-dependent ADH family)
VTKIIMASCEFMGNVSCSSDTFSSHNLNKNSNSLLTVLTHIVSGPEMETAGLISEDVKDTSGFNHTESRPV